MWGWGDLVVDGMCRLESTTQITPFGWQRLLDMGVQIQQIGALSSYQI